MKVALTLVAVLIGAVLIFAAARFADEIVAPLFFNSRIGRLHEENLPKVLVEGGILYCRMKADDFRFPLPPGSRAVNPVLTGGFDTVEGSVEARFDGTNRITASEYEAFLSGKVQIGGWITAQTISEGLLIKFHYFGDR
ncbi:MAG: hypothetical protein JWP08_1486 [Bryobacterales bacterium]|nr:hypothetical protein [Bryobacterales bacterium]